MKDISKLSIIFSVFSLLGFQRISYGQVTAPQIYKVVSLPRSAGYDITLLNKELSDKSKKSEVIRVIKSHRQLLTVPIVIRFKKSETEIYWWRISPGQPEKEGDFTTLQSKANESAKFYTTYDIQKYFRDTVVCFDTLRIGLFLQDRNFRIEDYFVKTDSLGEIALPFDKNNNVIISDSLFMNKKVVKVTLFNRTDLVDPVFRCSFLFLTHEEKQSLTDIAISLKEETSLSKKELAEYLLNYISRNYGRTSYVDVIHFLSANM